MQSTGCSVQDLSLHSIESLLIQPNAGSLLIFRRCALTFIVISDIKCLVVAKCSNMSART